MPVGREGSWSIAALAGGGAHAIVGPMLRARMCWPCAIAIAVACGGEASSSAPPAADEPTPAPSQAREASSRDRGEQANDDADPGSTAARWKAQLTPPTAPPLPATEAATISFHEATWQAGVVEDRALALDATLDIVEAFEGETDVLVRIACEHVGRTWLGSAYARHDDVSLGWTDVMKTTGRVPVTAVVDLPAPAGEPTRCELDARLVPKKGRVAQMQARACWTKGTAEAGACEPALPTTHVDDEQLAAIADVTRDGPNVEYTLDIGRRLPGRVRIGTRIACPIDLIRRPILDFTTLRSSAIDPGQSVRVRGTPEIARGSVRSGPCDVVIAAYDYDRVASVGRRPRELFVGCIRDTDIEPGQCTVSASASTDTGADPVTLHDLTVEVTRADKTAGNLAVRGRLEAHVALPLDAVVRVDSECRTATRYGKQSDTPPTKPVALEYLDPGDSVDFEVDHYLLGASKGWWCDVSIDLLRGESGPPVMLDERCVAMPDASCPKTISP